MVASWDRQLSDTSRALPTCLHYAGPNRAGTG